ncbi:hypothetical protein AN958_08063 [Leucoagaricus sp. SymC.cos]|nr:hypothetical protein AN958_08063 [Leucoagaricus sp. SymC.cos]
MPLAVPRSICELSNIEQLQGKNVVILFGKTRAGKSTFINDAYGSNIVKSTGSMTSDTDMISYVTTPLSGPCPCYSDIRDICLVDTVGLSGSGKDHHRALLAAKWIDIFRLPPATQPDRSSKGGSLHPTVKGFLYFIDISDEAGLNNDNEMNLQFFANLIGEDPNVLKCVVFVATKWLRVGESKRKGQERRFKEWKKELRQQFPGSPVIRLDGETSRDDIEDLDESLEENQTPEARARIAQEKASYTDNAFAVLRRVIATPATAATLLENEIRTSDGNEKIFKNISVSQLVITEAAEMELAFRQLGHSDLADIAQSARDKFGNTKVKDAGSYVRVREKYKVDLVNRVTRAFYGGDAKLCNERVAEILNSSGDIFARFLSLSSFVGSEQHQAMWKALEMRILNYISGGAEAGASIGKIYGPKGQIVGGVLGMGAGALLGAVDAKVTGLAATLPR